MIYVKANYDFMVENFDDLILSGGFKEYNIHKTFSLDYCKRFQDGKLGQGSGFTRILK